MQGSFEEKEEVRKESGIETKILQMNKKIRRLLQLNLINYYFLFSFR